MFEGITGKLASKKTMEIEGDCQNTNIVPARTQRSEWCFDTKRYST